MMSGEHGVGQVVKRTVTQTAKVALLIRLCFVTSIFDDLGSVAMGTFDAFWPTELANHLVALGIVDQSVNVKPHLAFVT